MSYLTYEDFYGEVCVILTQQLSSLDSINLVIDLCNRIEQQKLDAISREVEYKKKREDEELDLKNRNLCRFDIWYGGRCKKSGHPYCTEHLKDKCRCGAQATHDYDGKYLCDNHS